MRPSPRWLAVVGAGWFAARLAAQQPAPAARLLLESNGARLSNWVVLGRSDSLVLTIKAVDALGNVVPISGFEIQVWDPRVLGIARQQVAQSEAVVRFQSRRQGETTVQIRASGVRQWLLVHLAETALAISPRQGGQPGVPAGGTRWTIGGRVSGGLYRYSFNNNPIFKGRYGFVVEAYRGLEFPSGLELALGIGFGTLGADSLGKLVKPLLLEGYARSDYALSAHHVVRPVLSGGVGFYRARTGSKGPGIWNTSFEFLAGSGVDIGAGPRTVVELRLSTQQMFEFNSRQVNGYVGSLWLVGLGIRARL
ncbi:MAG TPA: hypothetical protein VKB63_06135 [Gemmatimonadales bacterium]|nr:hypothetical protein [Gemmatimonadales bacterium]